MQITIYTLVNKLLELRLCTCNICITERRKDKSTQNISSRGQILRHFERITHKKNKQIFGTKKKHRIRRNIENQMLFSLVFF